MKTIGTVRISDFCLQACEPDCECRRYDGFVIDLDEKVEDAPPWHRDCYCTIEVTVQKS